MEKLKLFIDTRHRANILCTIQTISISKNQGLLVYVHVVSTMNKALFDYFIVVPKLYRESKVNIFQVD
jgi:hypothetical protein